MDSNTYSPQRPTGPADPPAAGSPPQRPDWLARLAADLKGFDAEDLDRLSDTAVAEATLQLQLQHLAGRLDGIVLRHLAAVDARGAAGAEQGVRFGSTASWLRARLRMTSGAAASAVRTARALFRGPLMASGAALCAGEISAAHAGVLAAGTRDLADHVALDAEPVLLDAARRLDPHRLRQLVAHLEYTLDPDRADAQAQRRYERRGLWLTETMDRMVAIHGLLTPEAGQALATVLDSLSRPADAADTRSGGQRRADALQELACQRLESGRLPITGGVRPQLSVIIDLDSVTGNPDCLDGLGGRPARLGGTSAGPARWNPRPAGGWPATRRSPGWWSPASPVLVVTAAKQATPRTRPQRGRQGGWGRCWPSCPRSLVAPPLCP